MTEQAPKPLEDILAAVRSTLLPSPDDTLVRALIETIEARIEQDRQEIAALRAVLAETERALEAGRAGEGRRDDEIAALREKNSELNRRAHKAEAAVLAAVRGAGGPNLGRALANAAVGPLMRENEELRALCKEQAEALSERDRICKDVNAKWAETSSAMKRASDAIDAVCAEGRRDD